MQPAHFLSPLEGRPHALMSLRESTSRTPLIRRAHKPLQGLKMSRGSRVARAARISPASQAPRAFPRVSLGPMVTRGRRISLTFQSPRVVQREKVLLP